MSKSKKQLLVFIDTNHHDGHEADFRHALTRAIGNISHTIFSEIPKTPENIFSVLIGAILFSDAVLINWESLNVISPNLLIQYGICYALNKKCILVTIKNNSSGVLEGTKRQTTAIEGHTEFDYYLDFATQFKSLDWFDTPRKIYTIQPNKMAVHSFIAFGVDRWENPDLYEIVSDFSLTKGWTPRIVSNIGSLSKLESLSKAVSQRSFCIFCLDKRGIEQIFLGIGLAIGMGRPFLVIKNKNIELPVSLSGYHGIIEFESYLQLKDQLSKYEGKFLSDEVFEWEGTTYNDLLSKLEKRISHIPSEQFDEFESVLLTVNSILDNITARPLALLGELYREKNRKISPDNIELLIKAKECYEKALNIQKDYQLYQNAITAIDKHIQLIELIKERKYRSIPTLVNLIGGELKSDHYLQVKEYLLSVVNKLVEEKDYVHAISLLAAIQTHDKSEQIQNLVQKVLNLAPHEIIKALQDSQKDVVKLENEKAHFISQIKEKELKLDKISKETESLKRQIEIKKDELVAARNNLELIQNERDRLSTRLKDISVQLDVDQKTMSEFETKIESAKDIGRHVIVNFGHPYGWAVYRAIDNEPYVVRAGEKLSAQKGLVLDWGDIVYDEDGVQILELLPRNAIIIKPGDNNYADVSNIIKSND